MVASMERIGLPPLVATLFKNIYARRRISVNTAFGATEESTPNRGLEQGDVISPQIWNIFYDPLLVALNRTGAGYTMGNKTIAHGALADDLTLVADKPERMAELCKVVDEFFGLHDIKLNCAKSVHVVNVTRTGGYWPPPPLRFACGGDQDVGQVLSRTDGFRLLGAQLRLDGSPKAAEKIMMEVADQVATVIRRHAMDVNTTRMVVNTVLIPKLEYLTWGNTVSKSNLAKIERRYMPAVKNCVGLARSFPSTPLKVHDGGFDINSLAVVITSSHLRQTVRVLNTPSKIQDAFVNGLLLYREKKRLQELPLRPQELKRVELYADWLRTTLWWRAMLIIPPREVTKFTENVFARSATTDVLFATEQFTAIKKYLVLYEMTNVESFQDRTTGAVTLPPGVNRRTKWAGAVIKAISKPENAAPQHHWDTPLGERAIRDAAWLEKLGAHEGRWDLPQAIEQVLAHKHGKVIKMNPTTMCMLGMSWHFDQEWWSSLGNGEAITVYTDGSMKCVDGMCEGGFAAIVQRFEGDRRISMGGRAVALHMSSTTMEICAVLLALASLPRTSPVIILTDSDNVVKKMQRLENERIMEKSKSPDWRLWGLMRALLKERKAPLSLEHIKAHIGIGGNEAADRWAKRMREDKEVSTVDLASFDPPDVRFSLALDDPNRTQGKFPAWLLKEQGKTMMEERYKAQVAQMTHWQTMRMTVAPKIPPFRDTMDALQETHRHKFHAQLVHDLLPTMKRQSAWYSEMYATSQCMLCNAAEEDAAHLRRCPATVGEVKDRHKAELRAALETVNAMPEREGVDPVGRWLEECAIPEYHLELDEMWYGVIPGKWIRQGFWCLGVQWREMKEALEKLRGLVREQVVELWKVRCAMQIKAEADKGITRKKKRSMKSVPGAQRQEVERGERIENVYTRQSSQRANAAIKVNRAAGQAPGG